MLNRLSPRSRISIISFLRVPGSALSLNGNPSSPTEPTCPGTAAFGAVTASASEPRATVPSGGCRFAPSSLASNRGLSCMSCRQAETAKTAARQTSRLRSLTIERLIVGADLCVCPDLRVCPGLRRHAASGQTRRSAPTLFLGPLRPVIFTLLFDIAYLYRSQSLEEGASPRLVVHRVVRFNAQEEAVLRRSGEAWHIECRVIGLRQPVHQKIADEGAERRQQNRAFKRDWNERRQTQQRAPADVDRIIDGRGPVLQHESAQRAENAANQRTQRHVISVIADGLRKLFDREGRIGVDPAITRLVSPARRRDGRARRVELGHQAVIPLASRLRQHFLF